MKLSSTAFADGGRIPDLLALMQSLERADRSTRQELVEVDVWLARGG